MRRAVAALAVMTVCGGLTAGCSSSTPTVSDFCNTLAQQKAQYLKAYGSPPSGNPLADIVDAAGAIGQWVPMFESLQKSSPPAIEPQVANIVSSLKQQEQAMGNAASNPLGALASGLMSGLESSGSWQQVSDYITKHCGPNA